MAALTTVDLCRRGGSLMFATDNAMILTLIQRYGHDVSEQVQFNVLRSHQQHLFLDGLAKLGLDSRFPDADRCAMFHAFSNALGGLPVRYGTGSDGRAWLVYDTPYWLDSPWTPSIAAAALRPQMLLRTMEAWHANNGPMLGNDGLAFVFTHMVTEGDACDAGYFIDLGRNLDVTERLQVRLDEEIPDDVELRVPEFDPATWPIERQAKAWRNFSTDYVGGRIYWLLQQLTEQPAVDVFEYSFTLTLLQNRLVLASEFGGSAAAPVEAAAAVWAGAHRSWGDEVRIDRQADGSVTGSISRSRLHEVAEFSPPSPRLPASFEGAVARAWDTVLSYGWPGVRVQATGGIEHAQGWTFTFTGA